MDGGLQNVVEGSYIRGTDALGKNALPNVGAGVYPFSGRGNTIGGTAAGAPT